jgi:hypothetical protein
MLKAPHGLWGLIMDRWNLPLFPVQLRVKRLGTSTSVPDSPGVEGLPGGDRLAGLP